MTMPSCTAPTCRRVAPDAFVCPRCTDEMVRALTEHPGTSVRPGATLAHGMAALVTDLELAASRESRLASGGGAQSGETPLSFGYGPAEALWVLNSTLGTWVRELCEDRGVAVPGALSDLAGWPTGLTRRTLPRSAQIVACALFLVEYAESVRQSPGGGQLVDEVRVAVHNARGAIDRPKGSTFCGRCTHCVVDPVTGQGPELLAAPGAPEVACPNCGWTYSVDARQHALIEQLRDRLGTASEIAGMLAELFGIRVDVARISQWKGRHLLTPRGMREGHPQYRIGEVIDLAQRQAAPRITTS